MRLRTASKKFRKWSKVSLYPAGAVKTVSSRGRMFGLLRIPGAVASVICSWSACGKVPIDSPGSAGRSWRASVTPEPPIVITPFGPGEPEQVAFTAAAVGEVHLQHQREGRMRRRLRIVVYADSDVGHVAAVLPMSVARRWP